MLSKYWRVAYGQCVWSPTTQLNSLSVLWWWLVKFSEVMCNQCVYREKIRLKKQLICSGYFIACRKVTHQFKQYKTSVISRINIVDIFSPRWTWKQTNELKNKLILISVIKTSVRWTGKHSQCYLNQAALERVLKKLNLNHLTKGEPAIETSKFDLSFCSPGNKSRGIIKVVFVTNRSQTGLIVAV